MCLIPVRASLQACFPTDSCDLGDSFVDTSVVEHSEVQAPARVGVIIGKCVRSAQLWRAKTPRLVADDAAARRSSKPRSYIAVSVASSNSTAGAASGDMRGSRDIAPTWYVRHVFGCVAPM